jgi:hypothetical protein
VSNSSYLTMQERNRILFILLETEKNNFTVHIFILRHHIHHVARYTYYHEINGSLMIKKRKKKKEAIIKNHIKVDILLIVHH